MAKKVRQQVRYAGRGSESSLSGFAFCLVLVGVVLLLICLIVTLRDYDGELSLSWIAFGLGSLLLTITWAVIMSALADVVRLLKKQNNLPYSGEISGSAKVRAYTVCSECGTWVVPDGPSCPTCGAVFE